MAHVKASVKRVAWSAAAAVVAFPAFATAELVDGSKGAGEYKWDYFLKVLQDTASLMIKVAVMFGAAALMYAGWLYATSSGDTGKVSRAHQVAKNVAIGIAIAAAAYLIVVTIIRALGLSSGGAKINNWIEV